MVWGLSGARKALEHLMARWERLLEPDQCMPNSLD